MVPSDLVMVPNLPGSDTPEAALTGPVTGGQKVAQLPLHLDLVAVSGANQYSVLPWEFVSTVPMLVLAVLMPGPDPPPAPPVLVEVGLEVLELLPHPAISSAATTIRPAASHRRSVRTSFSSFERRLADAVSRADAASVPH